MRSSTGTLAPREDSIELIPAQTDATVVRIRVLPGAQVTPDTVIMDLADPQLEQEVLTAQLAVKGAQADYKSLQATLQSTLMDKKTAAAYGVIFPGLAGIGDTSARAAFLIGTDGLVQYAEQTNSPKDLPNFTAIKAAIAK